MDSQMNNKTAIDELMDLMMKPGPRVCSNETIFTAMQAIAFRTAKRPVYSPTAGATCSNCAGMINEMAHDFCPKCGLAILWDF